MSYLYLQISIITPDYIVSVKKAQRGTFRQRNMSRGATKSCSEKTLLLAVCRDIINGCFMPVGAYRMG
jgi:hypothetical protein